MAPRKRQTRIAFSSLPPSSPTSSNPPAKKRKVRNAPGVSSLSAGASSGLSAAKKESLPPTPDPTGPTQISLGASAVSDDSDPVSTQRLSRHKKGAKQKTLDFDLTPISPGNKSQAINTSQPVRAGFFGTQKQTPTAVDSSEEESSGQESLPELPLTTRRDRKSESKDNKKSKSHKSKSPDPQPRDIIELADESDADAIPTTPANRRSSKRKRQSSSPLIVDDEDEEAEDSDVVITGSRKRLQSAKKRTVPEPEQESSEEEEDEPPSRSRKRLRRGKSSQLSTITEAERQDLEDDLLDLASSGSDTEIRLRQKNQPTKKSARELALAQLKRKRGNTVADADDAENAEDQSDQEEEEEQLNNGEEDYEENLEDDDDDDDDMPAPSRTTRRQMFTQDEEDEGFVIDDDDGPLGAPAVPEGVPIAFTRYASMKAKDLFKFAIEWMVQKKINPAFQIEDEIYTLTFQKLDDEVRGLAGSKFTSAAWTPDFTITLQARPEIVYERLDRHSAAHFMRDKCDACNRSGHPATYEVRFEGKPYQKRTLEPVAPINDDSDSGSNSNSDSSSESSADEGAAVNRNAEGRKILPEETTFYLGKFCMSNAQTAHSLEHWRFHLYEWVVEYLEHAGYNTPANIVKRDKWSTRKRRKYANKIVDSMQAEGKIKALYRDFKAEIDNARNSKQGRWDSSP